MAYVIENTYTGDNSTVLFSFTFPYLEKTDVKVSIDQVDTTAFTFANATQIQLNSASGTNNKTIRIYRDTNIDKLKAEFFSGSAIRSQDLNEDFLQTLYSGQESEKAVELKWNKTTETLDSTEAFSDSNNHLMTAAAIDDRINTNIAAQPLADGKIFAGNGSGVSAAVTPSGDVTMANTGAFTIATGSVEHAMLAGDAIDGDNIQDDAVNSEHIAAGSIDLEHMSSASVDSDNIVNDSIVDADINSSAAIAHSKLANITNGQILVGNGSNVPAAVAVSGDVTLANSGAVTIANDAVEQAMIADDAVGADQLASNAVVNASVASGAAIEFTKLENLDSTKILVGNGSNKATEVSMSGDATIATTGAVTLANDSVEIGMIGCEQTTITDSDSHLPTSGAVVDYVAAQIAPIGGLEVIADDESFPNTIPAAGVVISIADAAGLQVNSSGVSTNGDTLDNSTVTINNFPTELRGGEGTNADPYVFASGAGLMVTSTGSGQVYNYHQALIREADFVRLSADIDDFNQRYRVAAAASGVRTGVCGANGTGSGSYPCDGDMYWNTAADKMYVYDKAGDSGTSNSDIDNAWSEVSSVGEFKLLELKDAADDSSPTYDGGNARSYNLKLLGTSTAASVTNAAQLLISVNGVIQKANSGTSVSGSGGDEGFCRVDADTIMFATAPASGSSVFIVQIGAATDLQVPADDSVSQAKIQNGAVDTAQLAADAVDGTRIEDDAVNSEHIAAGAVDLEHMSSQSVDEDNLYIDNAGSNGQFLSKQTGGTGGLLWATPPDTNTNVLAGGTITGDVVFDNATNAGNDLTWDMSDNALEFADDTKAVFGASGDLEIYHDPDINVINAASGNLEIRHGAEKNIVATNDGSVELYYDNVKEIETKSGGVKLNGHSECAVNTLGNVNSNPTFDFSVANYITLTLTGNVTVQNPTTESVGQSGSIIITQDNTGSRTCGWSNQFKWTGGTAPTLSTAASAVDRIDYLVVAADTIHCVASLAVS